MIRTTDVESVCTRLALAYMMTIIIIIITTTTIIIIAIVIIPII